MQFALLGQHADGWNLARALVDSGRHQLLAYTGKPPAGGIAWAANARRLTDLEEILADPAMVAVIVAGTPTERPLQLRRALQSERHAFCVHPADHSADIAYEAALLQGDTKQLLLPVLPEATHPAFSRLVELFGPEKPLGKPRFLAMERHATGEVLLDAGINEHKPSVPGWDVLRQLGGEISEISAYAAPEELEAAQPVLLSGRFVTGGLFQISLLPFHKDSSCRLKVECDRGRAE